MAALGRGLLARAGVGTLAPCRRLSTFPTCPSLAARAKCACGSCACEAGHGIIRRSHRERFAEAWAGVVAYGKAFSVLGLYIFLEAHAQGWRLEAGGWRSSPMGVLHPWESSTAGSSTAPAGEDADRRR